MSAVPPASSPTAASAQATAASAQATAAFFDMDRTVLRVNSGTQWMRYLRRRGELSRWRMLRAAGWAVQYKFAVLDLETLSRRLIADLAGSPERDMIDKCRRWFEDEIVHTICEPARAAVRAHRARGERCVLLTGGTPYLAEPVAAALEMDAVICSRLEVHDGHFTGRLVPPLCVGAGKVALAHHWAAPLGVDLRRCTFYTDSYNDLPMMDQVGAPVAVNPDPRLARVARRRGWAIQQWDGDPRP